MSRFPTSLGLSMVLLVPEPATFATVAFLVICFALYAVRNATRLAAYCFNAV